jgi:hypothetical protein
VLKDVLKVDEEHALAQEEFDKFRLTYIVETYRGSKVKLAEETIFGWVKELCELAKTS